MEERELNEQELEKAAGGKQTQQADDPRQILTPTTGKKHKIRKSDDPQG